MNTHLFSNFLADQVLIVFFFLQVKEKQDQPAGRKILSYLCLLPILLIMRQGAPSETILRILLRILSYSLFLYMNKGTKIREAVFAGMYGTLCFTTAQIFIGFPPLDSIIRLFFPIPGLFANLYSFFVPLLIKAAVLLPFYFAKPLSGKISLNRISYFTIIAVLIVETYLKFNSSNIQTTGIYASSNMVIYSAMLQLFLLGFTTMVIKYMNIMEQEQENALLNLADQQKMVLLRRRLNQDLEIRKLHHDMKNQLLALQNSSSGKTNDQIKDLLLDLDGFDISIHTGNEMIDSLISGKIIDSRKHGIDISVVLDLRELCFMRDVDLIRIIGNALDNAIESTIDCQSGKLIKVISEKVANYFFIHVINPYSGERKFIDGLPLTTKKDKKIHGLGLKSIRKCVEDYDGELHISTAKEGIFHLTIMIPLPKNN